MAKKRKRKYAPQQQQHISQPAPVSPAKSRSNAIIAVSFLIALLAVGAAFAAVKWSQSDVVAAPQTDEPQAQPAETPEEQDDAAPQATAPPSPPDRKIVVSYFHGTYRCPSCTTIEQLTEFAVTEGFQDALQDGRLEFQAINVETPETQHFIKDYKLYTKSVIVSEVVDGKERKWKNLGKIWQLFMKEKAFTDYIQQEVSAYLTEDKEQKE